MQDQSPKSAAKPETGIRPSFPLRTSAPSGRNSIQPTVDNREPTAEASTELTPAAVKSNIRNILLANPLFPKFYADTVIADRPNSKLAKVLRAIYPKILNKVKSNMANVHTCTHIRATGVRCGSPALRAEQFCYFHQRMHRGVRTPPQARLHPVANFEDEESIQLALMEVTNALMRNTIDLKRATLILRALHIAVKNASRVKYPLHANHMVKEIPDYAGPTLHDRQAAWDMRMPGEKPPQTRTAAERFAAEGYPPPGKIQTREEYIKQVYGYDDVDEFLTVERAKFEKEAAENAAAEKAAAAAARVGADTFVRPGGEAAVSHPESLPPQDFKTNSAQASPQGLSHPSRFSKAGNSDPSRKPAASVKEVNAAAAESSRRERKIAARSLS